MAEYYGRPVGNGLVLERDFKAGNKDKGKELVWERLDWGDCKSGNSEIQVRHTRLLGVWVQEANTFEDM